MGLAEMNSTSIRSPRRVSLLPYAAPAATTCAATAPWAPASTVTLRNPGPATSTSATPSAARSCSASAVASSRGAIPAFFASCIATLVA